MGRERGEGRAETVAKKQKAPKKQKTKKIKVCDDDDAMLQFDNALGALPISELNADRVRCGVR